MFSFHVITHPNQRIINVDDRDDCGIALDPTLVATMHAVRRMVNCAFDEVVAASSQLLRFCRSKYAFIFDRSVSSDSDAGFAR